MKLEDLLIYDPIVIQCHNFPDADALASAYGLYLYYLGKGKDVSIVYAGKEEIQKSNLKLMCHELKIPAKYVTEAPSALEEENSLLITVDCQYGAKNVDSFEAKNIAIIDHHRIEVEYGRNCIIVPSYGACSTVIWKLLLEAGFDVDSNEELSTALYYGLYMDTKEFAEIEHPVDRDAMDMLKHNTMKVLLFKNSNISLNELETAGIALLRYSYNDDYSFAVCKANECDPNVLGIISDFLIMVDSIKTCVAYCKTHGGFKYSVRSCVREVDASQLAAFLAEKMGSGGGHYDKAGGFISEALFEEKYPTLHSEGYFNNKMVEYFDMFDMVYPDEYDIEIDKCQCYIKRKREIGCVKMSEIMPVGTEVNIRTIEGDMDLVTTDDLYALIGIKGEVYTNLAEKFERSYEIVSETYDFNKCVLDPVYEPNVRNMRNGDTVSLVSYAKTCVSKGTTRIFAKRLDKYVKVFSNWDTSKYWVGKPGDYIACRTDDYHDVYIIDCDVFKESYSLAGEDN